MIGFLEDLIINVVLTTPLVGAYMLFSLGIVLIYRGSKVLNLAHGAMAMFPAYLAYSLAGGVGIIPATVLAVVGGGLIGLGIERGIVRRLRRASPTAQTVGTVGVLGLIIATAVRIWGTSPIQGPSVFPEHTYQVGNSLMRLGDIGLLVCALILAALLMALFKFTDLGLAMRCAADNRRAAMLMGIDPDRATATAWLFAGALAALGGVLLSGSTNLHPFTLSLQVLPAFVAALLGGLESLPGAVVGSLVVGLTIGIVPVLGGIGEQVGAAQVALTIVAFLVMSMRGQRFSLSSGGSA